MNNHIVHYILQNRQRYTREAIDRELQKAGFPPEQIAAGWQAVESGYVPPPPGAFNGPPLQQRPPRYSSNPWFWIMLLGYAILVPTIGALLIGYNLQNLVVFYLAAVLIGTVVGLVMLDKRNRPAARGLLWGLLTLVIVFVVLPFIAFVIIAGVCIVTGTTWL